MNSLKSPLLPSQSMGADLKSFRKVLATTGSTIEICPFSVDVRTLKGAAAYALMAQIPAMARFDLYTGWL